MRKAIDYLRAHPIVAAAVAIALVVVVWLIATTPRSSPTQTQQTLPAPMASPAAAPPAVAPPPAPEASPAPTPRVVAAAVDAGRPDPFAPLVVAASGERSETGAPAPPPAPPPPKEASTAELIGLLGDAGGVAILKISGRVYIVGRGDVILNKIKVQMVDVNKRVVILEEEGEKFELKWEG
jgi:hypothetical protein